MGGVVLDALTDDQSAVARLRLCSRRDNGWLSPLVQLVDNAPVAEQFGLPAVDDLMVVLVTGGTTTIESRQGARWHRADYHPGRVGVTAPGRPTHLRLNTVRVDRARRYLERGDLFITEIARLCGFASPSRLAIAFRQKTGLSPSAYRMARNKPTAGSQPAESAGGYGHLRSPICP